MPEYSPVSAFVHAFISIAFRSFFSYTTCLSICRVGSGWPHRLHGKKFKNLRKKSQQKPARGERAGVRTFQTLSGLNSGTRPRRQQQRCKPKVICQPAQRQRRRISAGAVCCTYCGPRAFPQQPKSWFLTASMRRHLKCCRSCATCTSTAHNLPSSPSENLWTDLSEDDFDTVRG